jgi:adenylyltransferase/sulfurtransferase
LLCKVGARSHQAVEFLREQGFKYVKNVKYGLDAWSEEIDRNVPRY